MKAKIDKLICSGIILSIFVGITGYSTGMIYGKSIDDENLNKLKSQFEEELSKNNSDGENSSDTSGSNDSGDKKDSSDSKGGNSSSSSKNSNSSKTTKTPSSNRTSRTSVRNSNSGSTSSPVNTSIPNKLKDGTYYGEANGYAGPVKVKVVVSGGKISDISVESHTETPGYYEKGAGVILSILSAQNTNVDSVSGATFTSNAIKSAVSSALRNAGAGSGGSSGSSNSSSDSEKLKKQVSDLQKDKESLKKQLNDALSNSNGVPGKLKDGTYHGESNGYAGPVKVKVVVSGGKISDISVESHTETPGYYEKGAGVISSILSAQSTKVDSVSGATLTSGAIKSAVSSALRSAGASSGGEDNSEENNRLKRQVSDLQKDKESLKKQLNDALSNSNGVPDKLKDGTYYGEAYGYAGPIKIKVVVSGGKISDISVESHTETPGYYEKGAGVISSILSAQSTKVDSVSGATLTSGAIKSAVSSALRSAGASFGGEDNSEENNRLKRQVSELQSEKESLKKQLNDALSNSNGVPDKLKDGTYYGEANGYAGPIKIKVVVSGGKISDISVESHTETPGFYERGAGVISSILSAQSTKVDSVTGATITSNGIKTAVKNALKKAGSSGDNSELLEKIDALTLENGNLKSENKKFEKMLEEYKEKIKLLDPNFGKTDDKEPNSGENTDTTKYDGTYKGEAEAVEPSNMPWGNESKYTIKLSITVKDGKITKIDDSETKVESPSNKKFFNESKDVYKQYIGESVHEKIKLLSKFDGSKTSGIDVVSNATVSSNAIHMAIKEALKTIKH